jgi:aspartate/methionine/tyrosine aminotransferase
MRIPERVHAIELPQFDRLNDVAAGWHARGADVISLGQALPGFAPPAVAVEALRAALDDPSSHIYSSDAGTPELRAALARWLEPLGARVDPEREVIITAGANQAFQLALTTLASPGDEVILAGPYFLNHEMAVRSIGALPIEAPAPASRRFAPTWDDILPCLTLRTRAVVLVSPSNPTGAVIARDELQRIVAACAARDVLVIVDETYAQFVYDAEPSTATSLPQWTDNVVVVGSFSKAFAVTGWRCGYLLAAADAIAEAMKIQDCMIICAPVPVQRAITTVLEHEPNYPRRWLAELKERRDFLISTFTNTPGLDPVTPAGGFFVMVRVLGCTDSRATAMALIDREQVVTIPGRFFGESGEGYLRISYGAATIERLRDASARIGHFVKQQAVR